MGETGAAGTSLSLSGLLEQSTVDCEAYKPQKFISHSSGG